MKISLVIVNYNGLRFLPKLLESIYDQTFKNFEVIFIDNSSTDGSIKYVREKYPAAIVFVNENKGYGNACNLGAKKARGEYILFLNEDMYLPTDFLSQMNDYREKIGHSNEKIGGISCKMVDFSSSPNVFPAIYGGIIDLFGFPLKNNRSNNIFIISGSPFFISTKLFNAIGGFNDLIFVYGEDVDLSWRLKLFGYTNFINHSTFLYHYGGGATGNLNPKKIANIIFGSFVSIFTNYNFFVFLLIFPFYVIYVLTTISSLSLIKLDFNYTKETIKMFFYFLKHRAKATSMRAFVQKNKKIKDTYIIKNYVSLIPAFLINKSIFKIGSAYLQKNQ